MRNKELSGNKKLSKVKRIKIEVSISQRFKQKNGIKNV